MLVLLTLARTITNVKGRSLLGLPAHEIQEVLQILGHLGIWVTLSSFLEHIRKIHHYEFQYTNFSLRFNSINVYIEFHDAKSFRVLPGHIL